MEDREIVISRVIDAPRELVWEAFTDPKATGRMVFPTAAERDKVVRDFGAIEGGKQTLGRLAEYLANMG